MAKSCAFGAKCDLNITDPSYSKVMSQGCTLVVPSWRIVTVEHLNNLATMANARCLQIDVDRTAKAFTKELKGNVLHYQPTIRN